MTAELGLFSLVLALLFSLLLVLLPTCGLALNKPKWMASAPVYVCRQFVFVCIAYACLTLCFLQDDFSVS
ncbi:MAG TPA: heme lyase NrfEFG subunit NrfE, partial [Legionella sp.]|nr:heme lyase NrfEFG subunit NrfE [Legionella sp.]